MVERHGGGLLRWILAPPARECYRRRSPYRAGGYIDGQPSFVLSVLALPLIPRQFFPSSDRPEMLVDLVSRQKASIYASEKVAEAFDRVRQDEPYVECWSTYVGRGAIRFYLPLESRCVISKTPRKSPLLQPLT